MEYDLMNELISNAENFVKNLKDAVKNKNISKIQDDVYALKVTVISMEDIINSFK